jgi:hypothetical protein
MAGVDLSTIKELLGHWDINMTRQYTHLSSDYKQIAVGKLEQPTAKVPAIFTTPQLVSCMINRKLLKILTPP